VQLENVTVAGVSGGTSAEVERKAYHVSGAAGFLEFSFLQDATLAQMGPVNLNFLLGEAPGSHDAVLRK